MEPTGKVEIKRVEAYRKAEKPCNNAWHPFVYYWNEFPGKYPYVEPHFHTEFEMDYVVSGNLRFNIGGKKYRGKKGDIFIIHPNEIHSIAPVDQSSVPSTYHTIIFAPELLSGTISERCHVDFLLPILRGKKRISSPVTESHPYYSEIQTSMDNIVVALKENTSLHDLILRSEVLRIFYFLLQYDSGNNWQSLSPQSQSIPSEIYIVLKYIAKNYSERISIQSLAQMSFLSNSRFITVFKRVVGMTPSRYLREVRLKNACRMLVDTDATIISIASACGFNNISNFNVKFKKMFGMPPQEYRCHFRDYINCKAN